MILSASTTTTATLTERAPIREDGEGKQTACVLDGLFTDVLTTMGRGAAPRAPGAPRQPPRSLEVFQAYAV